jgi:hypothetical protein
MSGHTPPEEGQLTRSTIATLASFSELLRARARAQIEFEMLDNRVQATCADLAMRFERCKCDAHTASTPQIVRQLSHIRD